MTNGKLSQQRFWHTGLSRLILIHNKGNLTRGIIQFVPDLIAGPKQLLTEFCMHYRLESCVSVSKTSEVLVFFSGTKRKTGWSTLMKKVQEQRTPGEEFPEYRNSVLSHKSTKDNQLSKPLVTDEAAYQGRNFFFQTPNTTHQSVMNAELS